MTGQAWAAPPRAPPTPTTEELDTWLILHLSALTL